LVRTSKCDCCVTGHTPGRINRNGTVVQFKKKKEDDKYKREALGTRNSGGKRSKGVTNRQCKLQNKKDERSTYKQEFAKKGHRMIISNNGKLKEMLSFTF
jgi:hypothetical protein